MSKANIEGNKAIENGDYETALKYYTKALQELPNDAVIWANRGGSYLDLKKLELAIADCNKAISIDNKLSDAYHNRGVSYLMSSEYKKAEMDLLMTLQFEKKCNTYGWLARIYYYQKNYTAAMEYAKTCIGIDPTSSRNAYYVRGCINLEEGRLSEATYDFEKALSIKSKAWYYFSDAQVKQQLELVKNWKPSPAAASPVLKKSMEPTPNKSEFMSSGNYTNSFTGDWRKGDNIFDQSGGLLVPLEEKKHKEVYDLVISQLKMLPSKYKVKSIKLIQNAAQMRLFHGCIEKTEKKEGMSEFKPNLAIESSSEEREKVLKKIQTLAVKVKHNRTVKIVNAWHGTSEDAVPKIAEVGFSNLAKLDSGWFGKGIYFSSHPEYSVRYCKGAPCLVMCYVILMNPYPIVNDDAPSSGKLVHYGKANYKNYGCHYVPIYPYNDTTMDYRPPVKGTESKYDEIVVFQEEHILPKYVVFLSEEGKPIPKSVSSPYDWSVDEVVSWMKNLKLSSDYSTLVKTNHINGLALATMKSKDDWKELGVTVFGDVRSLSIAVERLYTN